MVATVDTFKPYGDIREYAVKMFENRGRGIGQRGKDNGLLVLLAVNDRQVWVEVGYDLEEFITDGFAGETARELMVPEFRRGNYGAGLLAGVSRIRLAHRGAPERHAARCSAGAAAYRVRGPGPAERCSWPSFVLFIVINAIAGRLGGGRGWAATLGGDGRLAQRRRSVRRRIRRRIWRRIRRGRRIRRRLRRVRRRPQRRRRRRGGMVICIRRFVIWSDW